MYIMSDINLKTLDIEMKLRGFSKQTSRVYMFYNEKFLEYINKLPEEITENDIKEFLVYKMTDDLVSNSSITLIKASWRKDFKSAKGAIPGAIFKTGSALSIPFENDYFDIVVMWEVIEHLPKNTENESLFFSVAKHIFENRSDSFPFYNSKSKKTALI